jgi:hypothetical protein
MDQAQKQRGGDKFNSMLEENLGKAVESWTSSAIVDQG